VLPDGELRGVHPDRDATGAGVDVVAREGALSALVERARGGEGQRMRRDDLAGEQVGAQRAGRHGQKVPSRRSNLVGLPNVRPPARATRQPATARARPPACQRLRTARVAEEGVGCFGVGEGRRSPQQEPQLERQRSHRQSLRPRDIEDERRSGGRGEGGEGHRVRITLPDAVHVAHPEVDRLVGEDAAREVNQDAVAQVDGVVQADDGDTGPPARGRILEDALASHARCGVLPNGRERIVLA
jgi:hypothetical protein